MSASVELLTRSSATYLEKVVYHLLAHNPVEVESTLRCRESHPIDSYQWNCQVPHILLLKGLGPPQ